MTMCSECDNRIRSEVCKGPRRVTVVRGGAGMSDLKNPMRFSLRHNTAEISRWLDHENEVDDVQRRVTEIDIRPGEGNVYVHWEVVDDD